MSRHCYAISSWLLAVLLAGAMPASLCCGTAAGAAAPQQSEAPAPPCHPPQAPETDPDLCGDSGCNCSAGMLTPCQTPGTDRTMSAPTAPDLASLACVVPAPERLASRSASLRSPPRHSPPPPPSSLLAQRCALTL